MDFCVACHSEGDQDVRWDRPSHADLAFDTCASAGCHNYHDNRALYEDFLVEHAGGPALAPFNLAFDLLGVGPVARHGRGDSGKCGRTALGRIG